MSAIPKKRPGAAARRASPEESYVAQLAVSMNACVCFLRAAQAASPERAEISREELLRVDDALATAYWNQHEGLLTPDCVLDLMARASAGPSGSGLVDFWASAWEEMRTATLEGAEAIHGRARVQVLLDALQRRVTDYQLSATEFVLDYLLLQRGSMEDIRRAEKERKPGEARAEALARWDQAADNIRYEAMLHRVLQPDHVLPHLPAHRYSELVQFAGTRRAFYDEGLLKDPGA